MRAQTSVYQLLFQVKLGQHLQFNVDGQLVQKFFVDSLKRHSRMTVDMLHHRKCQKGAIT